VRAKIRWKENMNWILKTYNIRKLTKIFLKYNQQDAMLFLSIYFYKLLYMFQAVPPPIIRSTKLYIQRQVLSKTILLPAAILDEVELRSISSKIAAGSSIGLTKPDAVCTILCS